MVVIKETVKKTQDATGRPDWCVGQLSTVLTKASDRGLGVTYSNRGDFRLFRPTEGNKSACTIWEGHMERYCGGWIIE